MRTAAVNKCQIKKSRSKPLFYSTTSIHATFTRSHSITDRAVLEQDAELKIQPLQLWM